MKIKKLSLFILALSFFSLCSIAAPANINPAATPELTATQKTDGQIVRTFVVINTSEIKAAKLALKKSSNPQIKQFAHVMIKDHSKNLEAFKQLGHEIHPVSSQESNSLIKNSKEEEKSLKNSKDFNVDYINAMVKGHEQAIKAIDNSLSSAANQNLIKLLKATRQTVEHHLQLAKAIQSKMKA